jgi:hypothetical protein
MNDLRKPLNRGGFDRPPEDVDVLLRQFFRSEMPDPWPAAPPVSPLKPLRPGGRRGAFPDRLPRAGRAVPGRGGCQAGPA